MKYRLLHHNRQSTFRFYPHKMQHTTRHHRSMLCFFSLSLPLPVSLSRVSVYFIYCIFHLHHFCLSKGKKERARLTTEKCMALCAVFRRNDLRNITTHVQSSSEKRQQDATRDSSQPFKFSSHRAVPCNVRDCLETTRARWCLFRSLCISLQWLLRSSSFFSVVLLSYYSFSFFRSEVRKTKNYSFSMA